MRKDGVVSGWAKHSRNTAHGRRGHNKRVRQLPLPSEDEPAFRSGKKKGAERPFLIECRFKLSGTWGKWGLWKRYPRAETRDQALSALSSRQRRYLQYRKRDLP